MIDTESRPVVELRQVTRAFTRRDKTHVTALHDVNLTIDRGEFVVLLGPSGCGKSTLLRCVAGLERPDSGEILIDGTVCFRSADRTMVGPARRHLSMMFQSYALWPHMTVLENVRYPLQRSRSRLDKKTQLEKARAALDRVGVSEIGDQYPNAISGGQQQRVALARSLVAESKLMLFDEPLSNVDARVRLDLRKQLRELHHEFGFTAIYVTHDQDEAMSLANRIAVMDRGHLLQLDPPHTVYERPATLGVGRFIGQLIELRGKIAAQGDKFTVHTQFGTALAYCAPHHTLYDGDPVIAVARPENFELSASPIPGSLPCRILDRSYHGDQTSYDLESGGEQISVTMPGDMALSPGEDAHVRRRDGSMQVFPLDKPTTAN